MVIPRFRLALSAFAVTAALALALIFTPGVSGQEGDPGGSPGGEGPVSGQTGLGATGDTRWMENPPPEPIPAGGTGQPDTMPDCWNDPELPGAPSGPAGATGQEKAARARVVECGYSLDGGLWYTARPPVRDRDEDGAVGLTTWALSGPSTLTVGNSGTYTFSSPLGTTKQFRLYKVVSGNGTLKVQTSCHTTNSLNPNALTYTYTFSEAGSYAVYLYQCHVSNQITYTLKVGPQSITVTSTQLTAPPVPSGLSTTNITINSFRMNWSASANATSYTAQYKRSSSVHWNTQCSNTTNRYCDRASLSGTTYNWRVRANRTNAPSSAYSASQSVTLQTPSIPAPGAPTGLTVGSITQTGAVASWTAGNGATGYTVNWKKASASTWSSAATTSTSYTLSSLDSSTAYSFRVKSTKAGTQGSAWVNHAGFTTGTAPPVVVGVPSGLTSSPKHNGAALSWTAGSNAHSYTVAYRVTGTNTWTYISGLGSTIYPLTGLQSNTQYSWSVRGDREGSTSSAYATTQTFTTTAETPEAPAAPTGLAVGQVQSDRVNLSWNASANATAYTLEHKESGDTDYTASTVTVTTVNLTGLTPNTVHNWRVKASGQGGSSGYANGPNFTTSASVTPTPAVPTNLAAGTVTPTTIPVTWTASATATGYILQYKDSAVTNYTSVTIEGGSTTSYTIRGLSPNKTYKVRIRATRTNASPSAFTSEVTATTANATQAKPGAPTNLVFTNIGQQGATLNWSAGTNADGYLVEWKLSAATFYTQAETTSTIYALTGLLPSNTYNVRVSSTRDNADNSTSVTGSFETADVIPAPAPPRSVIVTDIKATTATVAWGRSQNATGYVAYWRPAGGTTWTAGSETTQRSYEITGLDALSEYETSVIAKRAGADDSERSDVVDFITDIAPAAVPSVNVSNITDNTAIASWPSAANATQYKVEFRRVGQTWMVYATTPSLSVPLSNLTAGTTYEVRVIAVRSGYGDAEPSPAADFTTTSGGAIVIPTPTPLPDDLLPGGGRDPGGTFFHGAPAWLIGAVIIGGMVGVASMSPTAGLATMVVVLSVGGAMNGIDPFLIGAAVLCAVSGVVTFVALRR